MKRSMIENIEPCLFYTYQPNSSFKSLGPGLSQSFKKKILDLLIKNQIHISLNRNPENLKETTIIKDRCLFCTITRECEYSVVLGETEAPKAVSFGLCRFCRDRVVAVHDFFAFITYLAQSSGKTNVTILAIFKQVLWLRRRMAMAQIGSCSIFENEISAILGPGGGGDWEKETDIVY
jgi:hypothetical protein